MPALPQLADPQNYDPCEWDLKRDAAGLRYWVEHFLEHVNGMCERIRESYPDAADESVARFAEEYTAAFRAIGERPESYERIDIYTLDLLRNDVLRRCGFEDPFARFKQRDTDAAMTLLPELLDELDACDDAKRIDLLFRGLLAGNLMDVGSLAAMERRAELGASFRRSRDDIPPRPWRIDGVDAWGRRWSDRPYRHVAFFIDNVGPDICLGVLPLVRWMLGRSSAVTLVANTGPALNDVTAPEMQAILDRMHDDVMENAIRRGTLRTAASGSRAPLLDLSNVTADCIVAIGDADLIMLHGMGRAVESNFRARFRCDATRSAMLKDKGVAEHVGGQMFECLFRFDPAGG